MKTEKRGAVGILVAVTTVVVLMLIFWSRNDRAVPVPIAPAAAPQPAAIPPTSVARHDSADQTSMDERTERNQARPEGGTGENQLEHMFRSVVAANAADLKLTPAQVDRLAADYLEYQEIYAEQAARFVQETSFDPASVTLRIPAYPVEGKLLRDMFYRRLETDFPDGKAGEIQQQLGGFFDNAFRGFGVTEQSFTITRSAEVPNAFEVRWESKTPEGHTTASLNPDVSFAGSAGTTLLYREQLATGEYRFLGNVLERRFPDTSGAAP